MKKIKRKDKIRESHPKKKVDNRAIQTIQKYSRVGNAAISAELVNEAMLVFLRYLFDLVEGTDVFENIDPRTHRILLPLPWAKHYREYGLRSTEADVLRKYIKSLIDNPKVKDNVPFYYVRNRLYIKDSFLEYDKVISFWKRYEITPRAYLRFYDKVLEQRNTVYHK